MAKTDRTSREQALLDESKVTRVFEALLDTRARFIGSNAAIAELNDLEGQSFEDLVDQMFIAMSPRRNKSRDQKEREKVKITVRSIIKSLRNKGAETQFTPKNVPALGRFLKSPSRPSTTQSLTPARQALTEALRGTKR